MDIPRELNFQWRPSLSSAPVPGVVPHQLPCKLLATTLSPTQNSASVTSGPSLQGICLQLSHCSGFILSFVRLRPGYTRPRLCTKPVSD